LSISNLSNTKISNHSFISRLLTINLRNKSIRKYRTVVIDVGTTENTLIETERSFKTSKDQADYDLYRATTIYWANLCTLRERTEAYEVDFIKDTPEN